MCDCRDPYCKNKLPMSTHVLRSVGWSVILKGREVEMQGRNWVILRGGAGIFRIE